MGDKVPTSPVVMASSEASAGVAVGTSKKVTAVQSEKPRAKSTHPKTAEMVNVAIIALKERGGSSVQAIKKFITGTYKIDTEKQATFIKKYLKAAVASGVLIQTKGKGAAGSFKLSVIKPETIKPKAQLTVKGTVLKKAATAKKYVATKKSAATTAQKATPTKKTTTTKVAENKKKLSKGPAAKPPKAKTIKSKPAAKSPAKPKAVATKKVKPVAAKPKKAAPKKELIPKK